MRKTHKKIKNKLKFSYLYSEPGKSIGNYTALEVMQLFYNKELFTEAGVPVPPADSQKAWTWGEFLEIAKKLTKDQNGKHPGDSGFDPKNIVQYGFAFGNDRSSWGPLLGAAPGEQWRSLDRQNRQEEVHPEPSRVGGGISEAAGSGSQGTCCSPDLI